MTMSFSMRGSVGVAVLRNDLTAATVDQFREEFKRWLESEPTLTKVVLDMGLVQILDSAGLGALMAALKRIRERQGDMRLAQLQKKPRMVFEITRAFKVIAVEESVDEAVQAFG
jgi:anti-sigma B factor antagonist